MADSKTDTPAGEQRKSTAGNPSFQAPAFEELPENSTRSGNGVESNIEVILDVPVTLSLEVGRAQMSVGQLLRLNQGAVVELDRKAGEPLDVLVNGALIARGEIVVVNDKFGIRLTEVVAAKAREAAL